MLPPLAFSPDELEFVETVGLHFETLGLPRIGGRIFALLILSPRPLLLDEIATTLNISRASVSVNTRAFVANGAIEVRAISGDRRQYYAMRKDVFFTRLPFLRRHLESMRRLFGQAQSAIAQGDDYRRRMSDSPSAPMLVREPPPAWGAPLRALEAPDARVAQGLLFIDFLESQLEAMEATFKQRFGAAR